MSWTVPEQDSPEVITMTPQPTAVVQSPLVTMLCYDQRRKPSRPSHLCLHRHHLQTNMQVFDLRGPFAAHGGQQRPPVPDPLRVRPPCSGRLRFFLIPALVSAASRGGESAAPRVVSEAFERVLAAVTAVVLQSHHRRLCKGAAFGRLVGQLVNVAQPCSEIRLGAALSRNPVAASEAGVAQDAQVPAHDPADVGSQRQVDDGVVDGGGLGKHGWHGESQRGNVVDVSKGGPHGHHSVGTPGSKETDADGNTQLEGSEGEGSTRGEKS